MDRRVRLSKIMAERGMCSRREADEFIAKGWVKVNGLIVNQLGSKVDPDSKIELSHLARRTRDSWVTILLNKPIGFVSGQPEKGYRAAVELITPQNQFKGEKRRIKAENFKGLAPAGRLDIDSQGLLVLTQDGRLAKLLIGENSPIRKEYLVRVEGTLTPTQLNLLRFGLKLDGQALKPADVDWINEDQLRFFLQEGKKRQIRRMCEAVGLRVRGLKRVSIGNVKLGQLPEGQWRFLQSHESF